MARKAFDFGSGEEWSSSDDESAGSRTPRRGSEDNPVNSDDDWEVKMWEEFQESGKGQSWDEFIGKKRDESKAAAEAVEVAAQKEKAVKKKQRAARKAAGQAELLSEINKREALIKQIYIGKPNSASYPLYLLNCQSAAGYAQAGTAACIEPPMVVDYKKDDKGNVVGADVFIDLNNLDTRNELYRSMVAYVDHINTEVQPSKPIKFNNVHVHIPGILSSMTKFVITVRFVAERGPRYDAENTGTLHVGGFGQDAAVRWLAKKSSGGRQIELIKNNGGEGAGSAGMSLRTVAYELWKLFKTVYSAVAKQSSALKRSGGRRTRRKRKKIRRRSRKIRKHKTRKMRRKRRRKRRKTTRRRYKR